jgi:type I restriction-modification system DNA methylase subunit
MSEIRERLTKLRQQEQETRGYGTSSAWYTALRPAISYLELAETATNPAEKFRNAWNAVYNLTMMMHRRGEIENVTFMRLIEEVQAAPKVRTIALGTPTGFFESLKKAQTTLLFDAESKKPRDAKQFVEIWLDRRKKRGDISPEKACKYLFMIGRDLRNALSHPKLDPNSSVIKKALAQAADIFVPLAVATTEAIIERPPEGTTGRVIAYRSFLYPFLKNSDSPFSDYYLERLFPEQELSAFPEAEGKASLKEINQELEVRRKELVRADADETLQRWCGPVLFQRLGLTVDSDVKIVADDGVFEPTAVIKKAELQGRPRHEYKAKDAGRDLACLIWVLPWSVSLDAVSRDEQFESLTMLEVAQRALSRADVDWAILTNGQQVRLLNKTTSHKARSFMEIDLVAIVERRVEREAQLAFRYLLGLCSQASIVERDAQGHTRLERALRESDRHGREISKELKENVFTALEELGEGFLAYMRSQPDELDEWRAQRAPSLSAKEFLESQELLTDIYQESLSLMYRLLFLFYAEGRDLLPMDEELYRDTYSLESIRDDIIVTHDDPSPTSFFSKGAFNLWNRLKELFDAVDGGWRNIIPAYNGGLFDSEQHQFLEKFKINDSQLASAIDLLSRTKPGSVRGGGRKKVTYRDLDIRHLGSIYEGILEYHAEIADQEKVVIKRGTSGKTVEEYVNNTELKAEERPHLKAYRQALKDDEENPSPPRGCKVTGLIEPGEYYLIYGGRESKRKSSGSYYTPDYIVQYIVDNTLGPLVRGECRPKPAPIPELLKGKPGFEEDADDIRPLSGDEILELKVLDPAMGSGHFLVAATEYLARAYGAACIREGKDKDGATSDEDFVHYKRIIAERCIYGVDKNPMAVELAKLSMWLFTMDKGRPLSFLNHHLKSGNSLIGTWIKDLGLPPEHKKVSSKKRSRRDTRTGNLFETRFREKVPLMVRDVLEITERETLSIADIQAKKALENAVENLKLPFKNIADLLVGLHFGANDGDYISLLLYVELARERVSRIADVLNAFHWELEFPEVFFDRHGHRISHEGFSGILGNPPWVSLSGRFGTGALSKDQISFLTDRFQANISTPNMYEYFVAQGLALTGERGAFGFIVPDRLGFNSQFVSLRQRILDHWRIVSLLYKTPFPEVTVDTLIFILHKIRDDNNLVRVSEYGKPPICRPQSEFGVHPTRAFEYFESETISALVRKIEGVSLCTPLKHVCSITSGFGGKSELIHNTQTSKDQIRTLKGDSIGRYELGKTYWFDFKRENITGRTTDKVKLGAAPKILLRKTGDRIIATYDSSGIFPEQSLYFLYENKTAMDFKFILGVLNSKLLTHYFRAKALTNKESIAQVKKVDLEQIPIPVLDLNDKVQRDKHTRMVQLVEVMLELKSRRAGKQTGIHNELARTESRIDALVNELYDLSEEEIEQVE